MAWLHWGCSGAGRSAAFALGAELPDRLASDFELPGDGALRLRVGDEGVAPVRRESLERRNRLENVTEIRVVALGHSGRASAGILCRNAGCGSRSVHRSTRSPRASPMASFIPTIRRSEVPGRTPLGRPGSLSARSDPSSAEPDAHILVATLAAAMGGARLRAGARTSEGRMRGS